MARDTHMDTSEAGIIGQDEVIWVRSRVSGCVIVSVRLKTSAR